MPIPSDCWYCRNRRHTIYRCRRLGRKIERMSSSSSRRLQSWADYFTYHIELDKWRHGKRMWKPWNVRRPRTMFNPWGLGKFIAVLDQVET